MNRSSRFTSTQVLKTLKLITPTPQWQIQVILVCSLYDASNTTCHTNATVTYNLIVQIDPWASLIKERPHRWKQAFLLDNSLKWRWLKQFLGISTEYTTYSASWRDLDFLFHVGGFIPSNPHSRYPWEEDSVENGQKPQAANRPVSSPDDMISCW